MFSDPLRQDIAMLIESYHEVSIAIIMALQHYQSFLEVIGVYISHRLDE